MAGIFKGLVRCLVGLSSLARLLPCGEEGRGRWLWHEHRGGVTGVGAVMLVLGKREAVRVAAVEGGAMLEAGLDGRIRDGDSREFGDWSFGGGLMGWAFEN